MSTKPRKPPGNLWHLQRLANVAAAAADMPIGRYQRWINTHIISAVLDRVRDEDGEPLFTLKGGAAMELRLGVNARASKDYDAAFRPRRGHAQRARPRPNRRLARFSAPTQRARADRQHGRAADGHPARLQGPAMGHRPTRNRPRRRPGRPGDRPCSRSPAGPRPDRRARADRLRVGALPDRPEDPRLHRGLHRTARSAWIPGFAAMATELGFYTDDVEVAADTLREFIADIDAAA